MDQYAIAELSRQFVSPVDFVSHSLPGPIKTPVGACATAAESVELGVETILAGKAKVMCDAKSAVVFTCTPGRVCRRI